MTSFVQTPWRLNAVGHETWAHPKGLPVNAKLVQALGLDKNQRHIRHFTLGHFHHLEQLRVADASAIESDRAGIEAAARHALPGVVILDIASLCKFHDMTAFVSWDGISV